MVGSLLRKANPEIKILMETLLCNKTITVMIDEHIVFQQLEESSDAIWSLLLASGYLKIIQRDYENGEYVLAITNDESEEMFRKLIISWFKDEKPYNGFILGLLVDLKDSYIVTSNRESGFGRYDVIIEPKDTKQDAFIFEFKVHKPRKEKTLQDTVNAALKQIEEKKYEQQLLDRGFQKAQIYKYGFAFRGKEVLIGDTIIPAA